MALFALCQHGQIGEVRAKAEVRFLPPYGPYLHPIERMWSKAEARPRPAAARPSPPTAAPGSAAAGTCSRENRSSQWYRKGGQALAVLGYFS